jgi:membrane peptidoglycan carboxypeptidase
LKLFGVLVVASVLVGGVLLPYVGGLGLVARSESDKFLNQTCTMNLDTPPPQKTTVYASDGKTVLATFFDQDRQPVPLSSVPKYLTQALIATEDRRFYSHHGVDLRGLVRSAFNTSNGDTQGGSTLTMQYVKQVRYYQAGSDIAAQQAAIDQTLNRKIEDAKCALDLEDHESKDQILDNYLNIAFYGENSYSIQSAAQTYFGKDVSKLTLPESAMLVGLVQAPSDYDPFQHPQAAKTRRNEVIQNLVDVGDITAAQATKYKAEPLRLATASAPPVAQGCANASSAITNTGFFCDFLEDWLTTTGGISPKDLTTKGYQIVTTLNANIQNSAQKALSTQYKASTKSTAILPVIDPKTGDVLAMVTNKSYGYTNDGAHTVAHLFTDATAQGASTYKYFSLIAALEAGAPPALAMGSNGTGYLPQSCPTAENATPITNAEPMNNTLTLAQATAQSSNTYFVQLEDKFFENCDLSPIVKTALNLGMTALNEPSGSGNLSVANNVIAKQSYLFTLGSGPATSPLQIVSAYATAANDGLYCTPTPVLSITDANKQPVAVKSTPCTRKMSQQVARTAVQVLTGDSQGNGTSAPQFAPYYGAGGSLVAGKTGTQNANDPTTENSAAWYVGLTPTIASAMAIFNPAAPSSPLLNVPGTPDGQATGSTAAGLWLAAMQPTIGATHWTWPDPNAIDQGIPVPSITGLSVADATAKLTAAGFKAQDYGDLFDGTRCASDLVNNAALPADSIAYYTPQVAVPGSTVTFCPADGMSVRPPIYIPPPPPPKPTTTPPPAGGATTGGAATGHTTPGGGATTPVVPNPPANPGRQNPGGGRTTAGHG